MEKKHGYMLTARAMRRTSREHMRTLNNMYGMARVPFVLPLHSFANIFANVSYRSNRNTQGEGARGAKIGARLRKCQAVSKLV